MYKEVQLVGSDRTAQSGKKVGKLKGGEKACGASIESFQQENITWSGHCSLDSVCLFKITSNCFLICSLC